MARYAEIDASGLTRFPRGTHPLWLGVLNLILIEGSVVACFIASYFYLMFRADQWPPEGLGPPPLLWPSINLGLLLISIVTMSLAGWGINRGRKTFLAVFLTISLALHCTVLVLRWLEFSAYEFSWDSHAYGSIVWTIAGFHYVHVASAIVGTAVIAVLAWRGYFTCERQVGVIVDTLYWNFVSAIWLPFYVVLYWVPRLM